MAKTKYSSQEYEVKEKKKLNAGRIPGFNYNIVFEEVEGHGFEIIRENATTEDVIRYLDNTQSKYVAELNPLYEYMCIICNQLAFKMLNIKTMWLYEPLYNNYVLFFKYDKYYLSYLEEQLQSYNIRVAWYYTPMFSKSKKLKFCPNWVNWHLSTLPPMTEPLVDKIIKVSNFISDNKGYYGQLNSMTDSYRIPQALCGRLAKSVVPYNTYVVLERILQIMSHSTAIIINDNLLQPYRFNFKEFIKPLQFAGRKTKKQEVCTKALDWLIYKGMIDEYVIADNGDIIITSAFITRHAKQNIKRKVGYFAGIPANKPYIITFLNYLWWIQNTGYHKITVALDTLLVNLNLVRLLRENRISEIARILNTLRTYGQQYNLLVSAKDTQIITGADVKYLLQNRTDLHRFLQIQSIKKDEGEIDNEKGSF